MKYLIKLVFCDARGDVQKSELEFNSKGERDAKFEQLMTVQKANRNNPKYVPYTTIKPFER